MRQYNFSYNKASSLMFMHWGVTLFYIKVLKIFVRHPVVLIEIMEELITVKHNYCQNKCIIYSSCVKQ
jgi:hypothetical protein